jgi:hypothetical protein
MKRSEVIIGIEMYLKLKQYTDLEGLSNDYDCRILFDEQGDGVVCTLEYPLMGEQRQYSETISDLDELHGFMMMVETKLNMPRR